MERRSFLAMVAAGVGTGWLAACARQARLTAPAPAGGDEGRTALFLDGEFAGWVQASGGTQIATRGMPDYVPGRPASLPPAPRRFHDLILEAGGSMTPGFYGWVAGSLASATGAARAGVMTATDMAGHAIATETWQGRIVQIGFPALSRDDCSPARLRVRIALTDAEPEMVSTAPLPPQSTRVWQRCDFRLGIAGLEAAAGAVTAVSAITGTRARQLSFTPLRLTAPASAAAAFSAWRSSGTAHEGNLILLDSQGRPVLTLLLPGLIPTSVAAAGSEVRIQLAVGAVRLAATG